MCKKITIDKNIPDWLKNPYTDDSQKRERSENEVKFVLPKGVLSELKKNIDLEVKLIDQIYLEKFIVDAFKDDLSLPQDKIYKEYRIRHKGEDYFFTAKSVARKVGIQRDEYETEIDSFLFDTIKRKSSQIANLKRVKKTRYSFITVLAQIEVLVELDDYHITGKGEHSYDFVTCEVEVPEVRFAQILQKDRFFTPDLLFIKQGFDVTGINNFSNRKLAEYGFVSDSFSGIKNWLQTFHSSNIQDSLNALSNKESESINSLPNSEISLLFEMFDIEYPISYLFPDANKDILKAKKSLEKIELIINRAEKKICTKDIGLTQDILTDSKFKVKDSKGRKDTSDQKLNKMDLLGKGWLRDYHTIISTTAYLRLNYKPQVFRPGGVGYIYSDTTTRGAHTSDVIASSMQLAKQMGLNMELCMASAAMHDIGHPAGGHVGEEELYKLSKKQFKHHIFSLSLAEMFGLNLLREVLLGSYYHKRGKENKLETPPGLPEEYGVIRIADKLSYVPWDFFDSIKNGYLSENSNHVKELINILGKEPMDWILKLTNAAVRESSEAHQVRFSEKSGEIFQAYQKALNIVRDEVHENINWESLRSQIKICYNKIQDSFSKIDPVPVIAYITDTELIQLTGLIESRPKNKLLDLKELKLLGFGFCELIDIMTAEDFDDSSLYYESSEKIVKEQ